MFCFALPSFAPPFCCYSYFRLIGKKGDGKVAKIITTKIPSKQRSGSNEWSSSVRNRSPELPTAKNDKAKSSSSVAVTDDGVDDEVDGEEYRVNKSTNKRQRKSGSTPTRVVEPSTSSPSSSSVFDVMETEEATPVVKTTNDGDNFKVPVGYPPPQAVSTPLALFRERDVGLCRKVDSFSTNE